MRADYSKLLFALSFLLLSIFATYCPILSLFSCVKAAERREALCAEGQYYDSGPGKCRTCAIPCKTSEQVCRDLGCFDYYIKSKKELCKPDEYYERTLEKCRPCSIPCSMSAEQCQQMGCTIKFLQTTTEHSVSTASPSWHRDLKYVGITLSLGILIGVAVLFITRCVRRIGKYGCCREGGRERDRDRGPADQEQMLPLDGAPASIANTADNGGVGDQLPPNCNGRQPPAEGAGEQSVANSVEYQTAANGK